MPKALTAAYKSLEAAQNAHEDFIGTGYPSEKVYVHTESQEVWILTPSETEREGLEILKRHDPREFKEADMPDI